MPFHPTCFDIFARLSRHHFNGRVDVNGLMGWYYSEHDYSAVHSFPHHPDVKISSHQWWHHEPGLEYLAANPLFVPALDPILRSVEASDCTFGSQQGAFRVAEAAPAQFFKDRFNTLPQELILEVLSHLPSRDIANLRLASRMFRQLPVLLWRHLLRKEMPWLWEVWGTDEPFKWATVSYDQLVKDVAEREHLEKELASIGMVIRQELPEIVEMWKEGEKALTASRPDVLAESHKEALTNTIWKLSSTRTNWFELYTRITRQWKDLKGLHNRARIWKDVEEIIERIKKYRAEGKICE
jgi:hypothetical protein